jgi:hypothetical protein
MNTTLESSGKAELSGCRDLLREGDDYLRVVRAGLARPGKFTSEIVFSVLSMAVEKLIMALVTHSGCLPENHTFRELSEACHAVEPLEMRERELLLSLDDHSNLCSQEAFRQILPSDERMAAFVALGERFQALAHARLGVPMP